MTSLKSLAASAPLRRLAVAVALGFVPGLAVAQVCPDYNVPANAHLAYDAGQLAQAQSLSMVAGGDVSLGNCPGLPGSGHVVTGADYELALTNVPPGADLRVAVTGSSCDPVLLVNDYTGQWHFNDDTNGLDPELVIPAANGVYDIWVGTWSPELCNATVTLQVGAGLGPRCPDPGLQAGQDLVFSAADLTQPQRIDVVAGGDIDLGNCLNLPGYGRTVDYPDFELTLTGAGPTGTDLTIGVGGQCDTIVLVNDPAGNWLYDDDGGGSLNAQLVIPRAMDGVYHIWTGTYSSDLCQATMTVSAAAALVKPGMGGGNTTPVPVVPVPSADPDPGNLAGYRAQVGQTFSFAVTGATSGSVWGSGVYTDDSALAAAAVHAGILQPGQSGTVTVQILGPQASFIGSPANGVTSSNYGSWGGSYSFVQ